MTEPDAKATEALQHLRAAVIELVEAARAALDVVEEVVSDPERMAPVVTALADLGRLVGPAVWPGRWAAPRPDEGPDEDRSSPRGDGPERTRSRVEHIRIS